MSAWELVYKHNFYANKAQNRHKLGKKCNNFKVINIAHAAKAI